MGFILRILVYSQLYAGVLGIHQISWLPCQFNDEHVFLNNENHTETQLIHREAILLFGQKGDVPVNPPAITFLVTGSKLDLLRYTEGAEAEQLECELRRYSTEGIHIRWPNKGTQEEYSRWFSCSLKHSKGLFNITAFLRHPSDQPPPGQQDYRKWPAIVDREILTTTVAMVMKTQSPSVKAGLSSQPKLHCQFALDHKKPHVTVEWHWQHHGERTRLFSHASPSGQSQGAGVGLKGLASGDASYTLPFTKMSSEGTYTCSVSVNPLLASLDVNLCIEEPPRVTINTGPTLSLIEGREQKVICEAESYYPLDVEFVWQKQDPASLGQRVGGALPEVLQNVHLSSHKHNQDKTFSLSAFFYLQASQRDSGKQFTCIVSHQSLRVPIKKSFILTVQEPSIWASTFTHGVIVVTVVALCVKLCNPFSVRQRSLLKQSILRRLVA